MKKISIDQHFDYPLAVLLRAREERYRQLDKFPELKNVTTIKEEREGNILKQIRHISIADSMPVVLTTLLPAGSTVLVEDSEFNSESNVHTFRVVPGGNLDSIFTVTGVSKYYSIDDTHSGRNYEIEIRSQALFVSMLIEGAIADLYHRNLDKDQASILHFISMLESGGEP